MSWSKSASGTAEQVKATCANWADEQKTTDQGMTQEAIDGHKQQVQAAAKCVTTLADALGDGVTYSISAYGHHNGDQSSASGGLSVNYTGFVQQS